MIHSPDFLNNPLPISCNQRFNKRNATTKKRFYRHIISQAADKTGLGHEIQPLHPHRSLPGTRRFAQNYRQQEYKREKQNGIGKFISFHDFTSFYEKLEPPKKPVAAIEIIPANSNPTTYY